MAKVPERNDGELAQKLVQSALMELEKYHPITWVRLYDSKSAGLGTGGNFIPPQPADFIYAVPGGAGLLEVKSSIVHQSLTDCTIKDMFKESQILGARLWKRAGHRALCAFYSVWEQRWEIWDMEPIVAAYLAPPRKRKLQYDPIARFPTSLLENQLYVTIS